MPVPDSLKAEALQEIIADSKRQISLLQRQLQGVQERICREEKFVEVVESKLMAIAHASTLHNRCLSILRELLERNSGSVSMEGAIEAMTSTNELCRPDLHEILKTAVDASPDIIRSPSGFRLGRRRFIADSRNKAES